MTWRQMQNYHNNNISMELIAGAAVAATLKMTFICTFWTVSFEKCEFVVVAKRQHGFFHTKKPTKLNEQQQLQYL